MKKRMSLLTVAFAVAGMIAIALPAAAAELHEPHTNTPAYGAVDTWHFVNNQTQGATEGWIYVNFNGDWFGPYENEDSPAAVLHFYVDGPGPLVDAVTVEVGEDLFGDQIPGRLVLSDHYAKCCGCGCR
jgi:hypothetical protein